MSEPIGQEIRYETGGATVAVRERMDGHETVMEPHRDLVRRIGVVVDPVAGIVQGHGELDRDMGRVDPDIALGSGVVASPCPDIAEQLDVKLPDERVCEDVPAALAVRPSGASSNVRLLGLVQLTAVGNPGLEETLAFLRLQRRGVVGRVELGRSRPFPEVAFSDVFADILVYLGVSLGLGETLRLQVHRVPDARQLLAGNVARACLYCVFER